MSPTSAPSIIAPQIDADKPAGNGWEKLLRQLDPTVVSAVANPMLWQALEPHVVTWLLNTVARFPWLNTLALIGAIHTHSGATCTHSFLGTCHTFLRWAIPDHYPSLAALKPEEALEIYFGDPPRPRGQHAYKVYQSFQHHVQHYLTTLPVARRTTLAPYLLPTLKAPPRLQQLARLVGEQSHRVRKKQAFAVVNRLPHLIALARQRYRWLADLEAQVQHVARSVQAGETSLPVYLTLPDLTGHQDMTFRIWDRASWIAAHQDVYFRLARPTAQIEPGPPFYSGLFLQWLGDLPEPPWFLRAIAVGALQGSQKPPPAACTYLQQLNAHNLSFGYVPGLLAPTISMGRFLYFARRKAAQTPADSSVLFWVEPLLAAASVALFILISLVSTGMRLGELQQVTLDYTCMEYGQFPQFDDRTQTWTSGPKRLYWKLYPKGASERERYFVSTQMAEAMFIMLDLHKRYYGPLQALTPSRNGFAHARRFAGQHKFVLQWAGRHLPNATITQCLTFLLLEHGCQDEEGQAVNITAHLLRHAVAGWLRRQGMPLEDLMALLKQVNIAVTDYYSQPSPQDLYQQIGPALTALANLAQTDPLTIRTVGDIQNLAMDALKRYGVLRHTPGGTCAVFTPCEVQFKCASCPAYIPDPARRHEVHEKIISHKKAIQLFDGLGDYLQADAQKTYLRDWERVAQEMKALAQVDLISPPVETVMAELGPDDLGEQLQDSVNQWPKLSSGGNTNYGRP